ncbi:hypothetical protein NM688_g1010 [Phlebia brevispora]|uniref:Uncharacterized protein n=1 Tax=Phlebia brevispora TaxID=194682 RepID=A0ACC1TCQ9_9APHY|nr:hypothetical protein NM688_g1010 [Phlebia brevispora]
MTFALLDFQSLELIGHLFGVLADCLLEALSHEVGLYRLGSILPVGAIENGNKSADALTNMDESQLAALANAALAEQKRKTVERERAEAERAAEERRHQEEEAEAEHRQKAEAVRLKVKAEGTHCREQMVAWKQKQKEDEVMEVSDGLMEIEQVALESDAGLAVLKESEPKRKKTEEAEEVRVRMEKGKGKKMEMVPVRELNVDVEMGKKNAEGSKSEKEKDKAKEK